MARATANRSPDTDCIMAEVSGMFIIISGSSPFLYFTRGVLRDTFAGMQFSSEYPGISRYSLKVWDGSLINFAIFHSPLPI